MKTISKARLDERGFTLIELLTVIAIIGILSTLGMVSLNGARQKAYDAQMKSDIANIRTSLAMCSDSYNGSYIGCTVPINFSVPQCSSDYGNGYNLKIVDANTYVLWAGLCSQLNSDFCADSTGFAGVVTTTIVSTTATQCQ
ncbi:MAG: type II secretion system protein [Patescibacteria group bacterium]|jgi:prepilin-type N-terminal cleavage/methylation domain-containing protein